MLGFIEIMTVPASRSSNRLFSLNIGSNLRDLIAYSIVLIILIFRPHRPLRSTIQRETAALIHRWFPIAKRTYDFLKDRT